MLEYKTIPKSIMYANEYSSIPYCQLQNLYKNMTATMAMFVVIEIKIVFDGLSVRRQK